jgi:hypothetical protein
VTDRDHHLERQSLLRALAKGRKFPLDAENPPPASDYEKQLIAEARRRGIKAPRPTALTKQWRHYLEWQIGRSVVRDQLSRRKRGQRGKQKSEYMKKTSTPLKVLSKKREAYDQKIIERQIGHLLRQEKK